VSEESNNRMIPRQVALDYFDKLLEVCNFDNREDWNRGLDLRKELKEWDETSTQGRI